ncbi:hypothetical protein GFS31_02560 [Leptolyngbya sp. BL0902]|nr:hypothetical protein GFS31_02560 [Leptolyngbya sp. BL0902]
MRPLGESDPAAITAPFTAQIALDVACLAMLGMIRRLGGVFVALLSTG